MEMKPVKSSNVKEVGYNKLTKKMRVRFMSMAMYEYSNVPPEIHEELMGAASKGRYINSQIVGKYKYKKV